MGFKSVFGLPTSISPDTTIPLRRSGFDTTLASYTPTPSGLQKTISITGSSIDLTDYPVKLTVPYEPEMAADFRDIRFYDSDHTTELSYWIEEYTASTSATVWVKVPSIPVSGTTIYMHYGCPMESKSNGEATFEFFDDFERPQYANAFAFNSRMTGYMPDDLPDGSGHAQGIEDDGNYLYITNSFTIWKRRKSDYVEVARRDNCHLDGTPTWQINAISIHGDYIYVGASIIDPPTSYIKVYNKHDLSFVGEHRIVDGWSEGCSYHDGYFWCVYYDKDDVVRYDENWNYVDTIPNIGATHVQGSTWHDGFFYIVDYDDSGVAPHPINIKIYRWHGGTLELVKNFPDGSYPLPNGGDLQDLCVDVEGNAMWFAEAHYPNGPHAGGTQNTFVKEDITAWHDGSIDDKWSHDVSKVSTANSILTMPPTGSNQYIITYDTFSISHIFRSKIKFTSGGSPTANYQTAGFSDMGDHRAFFSIDSVTPDNKIKVKNVNYTVADSNIEVDVWKTYEIHWTASSTAFYKDGVEMLGSPLTTNIPTIDLPIAYFWALDSPNWYVDYVLVRKYANPEPVATFV